MREALDSQRFAAFGAAAAAVVPFDKQREHYERLRSVLQQALDGMPEVRFHIPSESVPYIVHESAMARAERTAKRLWITILTLIFLLVGSNCVWIWWNSQWETVYQEVTQESDKGTNNFVGGDVIGETDYQNP